MCFFEDFIQQVLRELINVFCIFVERSLIVLFVVSNYSDKRCDCLQLLCVCDMPEIAPNMFIVDVETDTDVQVGVGCPGVFAGGPSYNPVA